MDAPPPVAHNYSSIYTVDELLGLSRGSYYRPFTQSRATSTPANAGDQDQSCSAQQNGYDPVLPYYPGTPTLFPPIEPILEADIVDETERKTCGIKHKLFFPLLIAWTLMVVVIAVGLGVGVGVGIKKNNGSEAVSMFVKVMMLLVGGQPV
jgi:hypothetical protein